MDTPLTATPCSLSRKIEEREPLDLIVRLCHELKAKRINYCHWKSNQALAHSAHGDNDLDFLVSREDAQCFLELLCSLGFKEAFLPRQYELPGVRDYYGYDQQSGRLVHVHAHFQLILGNDLSKNYRLHIEKAYLESSIQRELFRVPPAEFELLVFVIRMMLKHGTWDSILLGHGRLTLSEFDELESLSRPDTMARVPALLEYIPGISSGLFNTCLRSLLGRESIFTMIKAGERLQKALQSSARRPQGADILTKCLQRIWQPLRLRILRRNERKRMANGGVLIAVVGGDGAGKTTAVNDLFSWLSANFVTARFHMGKPSWSWTTFAARAFLKIGTILRVHTFEGDVYEDLDKPHGLPWFVRAACTARDRYLTYARAQRLATNGAVVIFDRYALPGFMTMDGPQCSTALVNLKKTTGLHRLLARWESAYYQRIDKPDLLVVLKLEPSLAVQRKCEETEPSVRARSGEVWDLDWRSMGAFILDASQSKADVLSQLRSLIWSYL